MWTKFKQQARKEHELLETKRLVVKSQLLCCLCVILASPPILPQRPIHPQGHSDQGQSPAAWAQDQMKSEMSILGCKYSRWQQTEACKTTKALEASSSKAARGSAEGSRRRLRREESGLGTRGDFQGANLQRGARCPPPLAVLRAEVTPAEASAAVVSLPCGHPAALPWRSCASGTAGPGRWGAAAARSPWHGRTPAIRGWAPCPVAARGGGSRKSSPLLPPAKSPLAGEVTPRPACPPASPLPPLGTVPAMVLPLCAVASFQGRPGDLHC